MLDNRKEFQLAHDFDFVEEFILRQKNTYYFYIDVNKHNIMDAPLHYVYHYQNLPFENVNTLNELLAIVNVKSELCEVFGAKQFCDNIRNNVIHIQDECELSIPIIGKNGNIQLVMRLKYQTENKLYLGQFQKNQDDILNEMLFEHSFKDTLTGLFNRNALNRHINELENDNDTFGIMIDLDEFKAINDTYGHESGDFVLQKVGETLLSLVNSNRIFYRISGDEFFVQVKNTDYLGVIKFTSAINEAISKIKIGDKNVTCSIGAVQFNREKFVQNRDIMRLADLALYKAKYQGRNQTYILTNQEIDNFFNNQYNRNKAMQVDMVY